MVKELSPSFPSLLHNPWIRFEDLNGLGWAQPDLVIPENDHVRLIEVKLTRRPVDRQVALYGSLLGAIFGLPVRSTLVFHNPGRNAAAPSEPSGEGGSAAVARSAVRLEEALLGLQSEEGLTEVHWLGF